MFDTNPEMVKNASSLALAHIGDAVFELLARTEVLSRGGLTSGGLHRETVRLVSAKAQAQAAQWIEPMLSEEELSVFRRGRNTRSHSVPKGASVAEYRYATALEALFGHLYLTGAHSRIEELFALCLENENAT